MLLDYAKLRMVQWFLIYTHQSGGSLLIVEEIIFCRLVFQLLCCFFFHLLSFQLRNLSTLPLHRENWQKRRSCSFLPSKKLKKDLGSGIHMLLLLAIIWLVFYLDNFSHIGLIISSFYIQRRQLVEKPSQDGTSLEFIFPKFLLKKLSLLSFVILIGRAIQG